MTTRTDDDLERLLRATLEQRGSTVTEGPQWDALVVQPRPRRPWLAPLIAAAIVLALVAAFVVVRAQRESTPAAGTDTSEFTSFDVPGYEITSRGVSTGGLRDVTVRLPGGPVEGSVSVTDWTSGYRQDNIEQRRSVIISGHSGTVGPAGADSTGGRFRRISDVSWQYAPGRWMVVNPVVGMHSLATAAQLVAVARAVRPEQQLPFSAPFRLSALPDGFAFDQLSVQSNGVVMLFLRQQPEHVIEIQMMSTAKHPRRSLAIDAFRGDKDTARLDRDLVDFVRMHLVWGTTDVRDIVP